MLHSDNPLSHGLLDEEPSDVNFYGYEAHGPTCLGDDNNVVLEPIEFEHIELLESYVLASVDPLADSNDMGVDLFCKALSSASKSTRNLCKLTLKSHACSNSTMGLSYISHQNCSFMPFTEDAFNFYVYSKYIKTSIGQKSYCLGYFGLCMLKIFPVLHVP